MMTPSLTELKARFRYADKMLLLVSRTFALNINRLSGSLRKSVLLAYLYLRIADTVEDSPTLPAAEKQKLLGLFADIFKDPEKSETAARIFVDALPKSFGESEDPNEELCSKTEDVVSLLWTLDSACSQAICGTVIEMCEGMSQSIAQMESSLESGWFTLGTMPDLLRYCYYVAGIVGKLLTGLFAAGNPAIDPERLSKLKSLDVSFGLALQLTNIVKDVREDSERRVCFVPESVCRAHGFENSPSMFAVGANIRARASVMKELVNEAWKHLSDAIEYTVTIPRRNPQIRLFCLWPLFMAAKNLSIMGDCSGLFDKERKLKITRDDVRRIIKSTTLHFYSNSWIRREFAALRDGT